MTPPPLSRDALLYLIEAAYLTDGDADDFRDVVFVSDGDYEAGKAEALDWLRARLEEAK